MPNTPKKARAALSNTRIQLKRKDFSLTFSTNSERIALVVVSLLIVAGAIFGYAHLRSHKPGNESSASAATTPIPVSGPTGAAAIAPDSGGDFSQTADGASNKNTVAIRKSAGPGAKPAKVTQKASGIQNTNSMVIE